MSVQTVFEIRATPDEPMAKTLEEIQALPHWERELMSARIMRFEADRRIEAAAGALALRDAERRRMDRAAATRLRNREGRDL